MALLVTAYGRMEIVLSNKFEKCVLFSTLLINYAFQGMSLTLVSVKHSAAFHASNAWTSTLHPVHKNISDINPAFAKFEIRALD